MTDKKKRVLDLFCGAGGFSEGFRQAGFEIVAAVDNWDIALKSHKENHHETQHFNLEIGKDSFDEVLECGPFDVVIGSPPCTDFSNANPHPNLDNGLELVHEFLKIIEAINPKHWIGENVPTSRKTIEKQLPVIGEIFNSADFGVPQKRIRYFFGKYYKPKVTHQKHAIINLEGEHLKQWKNISSILEFENGNWLSLTELPTNARKRIIDFSFQKNKGFRHSRVLDIDKPSPTITAHHDTGNMYVIDSNPLASTSNRIRSVYDQFYTVVGRQNFFLCDVENYNFRKIKISELTAIMGFPLEYQFIGGRSSKIKQIGNAVCPPIANAFAIALQKTMGAHF